MQFGICIRHPMGLVFYSVTSHVSYLSPFFLRSLYTLHSFCFECQNSPLLCRSNESSNDTTCFVDANIFMFNDFWQLTNAYLVIFCLCLVDVTRSSIYPIRQLWKLLMQQTIESNAHSRRAFIKLLSMQTIYYFTLRRLCFKFTLCMDGMMAYHWSHSPVSFSLPVYVK